MRGPPGGTGSSAARAGILVETGRVELLGDIAQLSSLGDVVGVLFNLDYPPILKPGGDLIEVLGLLL